MKLNLFKRKEETTIDHIEVFTGAVRFVNGSRIKEGRIFGRPYRATLIGHLIYYVEADGKVYTIPEYALERKE